MKRTVNRQWREISKMADVQVMSNFKIKDLERRNKVYKPFNVLTAIHKITDSILNSKSILSKLNISKNVNLLKIHTQNFKTLLNVFSDEGVSELETLETLKSETLESIIIRWIAYFRKQTVKLVEDEIKELKIQHKQFFQGERKEYIGGTILNSIKFWSLWRKQPIKTLEQLDNSVYLPFFMKFWEKFDGKKI